MEHYADIRQALLSRGSLVCPIKGASMCPMLNEKEDAVLLVLPKGRLQRYEIPLYLSPDGKQVLHRIIAVKKDHYVICGDNCLTKEIVPFDAVIAVAKGYFKRGVYYDCAEAAHLRYAKRRVRGRPLRALRAVLAGWLR